MAFSVIDYQTKVVVDLFSLPSVIKSVIIILYFKFVGVWMSQFPGTNNNLVVAGAMCLALAEFTGCSRETTSNPLANKPDAIEFATLVKNQDDLLNQEITCRGFAIYNGCELLTPRMPGQPEMTNLWALLPTTELPTTGPSNFSRIEDFVGMRSEVLSKEQNTREIALGGGRVPQEVMVTGMLVQESDGYRYFKASNIQPVNSVSK